MSYTSLEIQEINIWSTCPECGTESNEVWRVIGVNLTPEEQEEFDKRETSGIFCPKCGCVGWG